jgi:hypothetical protein
VRDELERVGREDLVAPLDVAADDLCHLLAPSASRGAERRGGPSSKSYSSLPGGARSERAHELRTECAMAPSG